MSIRLPKSRPSDAAALPFRQPTDIARAARGRAQIFRLKAH